MPWDAIGNLILGLWKSHKFEKWVKAWTSVVLSALLTFLFVWGSSIGALYHTVGATGALVLGFGAALVAASGATLTIVRKVTQFKEIALFFPSAIENAIAKIQAEGGSEFDPNQQKPG
jgi:hypothetical protein